MNDAEIPTLARPRVVALRPLPVFGLSAACALVGHACDGLEHRCPCPCHQ